MYYILLDVVSCPDPHPEGWVWARDYARHPASLETFILCTLIMQGSQGDQPLADETFPVKIYQSSYLPLSNFGI